MNSAREQADIAKQTLEDARAFLDEAINAATSLHRAPDVRRYLGAAIVFGRSVTLHVKAMWRGENPQWYTDHQTRLQEDELARWFVEARNHILKTGRGPGKVQRMIVAVVGGVRTVAEINVSLSPWWKRDPRTWFVWVRPYVHAARTALQHRRTPLTSNTGSEVRQRWHFEGAPPPWSDKSAFELVEHYLELLQPVVAEAQARTAPPSL